MKAKARTKRRKKKEKRMPPTQEIVTRWREKEWTWTTERMEWTRMMRKRVCSRVMLILIQEEEMAWNNDWSKSKKISRPKRLTMLWLALCRISHNLTKISQ